MNVRILLDPYRTQVQPGIYHVDTQTDYVGACRRIDGALLQKEQLDVAVHNPAMKSWFDHYRICNDVTIEVCDPCEMLAKALGLAYEDLPQEIRDDPNVILSESLLEHARVRPRTAGEDVISWLLAVTLGPVWSRNSISSQQEVLELVSGLASGPAETGTHSTVRALRNRRVDAWRSSSRYASLIRWIFGGSPRKRAESLLLCRVIWAYPEEVRRRALQFDGRWAELSQLSDLPDIMQLIPLAACRGRSAPSGYATVIREYLCSTLNSHSLGGVLPFLSGYLEEEAKAVKGYLEQNAGRIDESWSDPLRDAERIFADSGLSRPLVSFLHRLQPVPRPTPLQPGDPWRKVRSWLEQEYFPFFAWCLTTKRLQETSCSVAEFEDWLLENYDALTRTDAFAPYALREILRASSSRKSVLLVIVDGLPWGYAASLRSLLSEQGLKCTKLYTHITTIPSLTATAKLSLVCGQLPGQVGSGGENQPDYAQMFASALGITGSDVAYGTSLDIGIVDMVREYKKAYLYLFNDVDQQLIHRPLSHDMRHSQIESSLAQLAGDIASAKQEFVTMYGEELTIAITSDHGFTEVPKDTHVLKLPTGHTWEASHGRVVRCGSVTDVSVAGIVAIDGRILGGMGAVFLVSKGYVCLEARPRGAVHGGLTPQEMVVPTLVIDTSADVQYRDIELGVVGEIRRGRSSNPVNLELVNSNSVPVVVKSISLQLLSIETGTPLRIGANAAATLQATVDATTVRQEQVNVTGVIVVDFGGETFETGISQILNTTGAATIDRSFEDEFEV